MLQRRPLIKPGPDQHGATDVDAVVRTFERHNRGPGAEKHRGDKRCSKNKGPHEAALYFSERLSLLREEI